MADHIFVRPAEGVWVVRAGGAVLGESEKALELSEGEYPVVIYFPREDVAMEFLDDSEKVTNCKWKGDAKHFSIVTKSKTLDNAAWSYEDPLDTVAPISGHIAFYPSDEVAVERV